MHPLHSFIFKILRKIEEDATFDQDQAVESLRKNCFGKKVFSFDLSAATDRLPVIIQTHLLEGLITGLGKAWSDLLVSRDYIIPADPVKPKARIKDKSFKKYPKSQPLTKPSVRYSVGQPMGALSS